jgi:hypothetical protein
MKQEDYVSLECAKMLKEKGFNEPVFSQYTKHGSVWRCNEPENFNESVECFSRPTLYEAQKWLREIHNIDVLPVIREESPKKDYCCNVYKNAKVVRCKVAYGEDFYECMNEGLVEALNLI